MNRFLSVCGCLVVFAIFGLLAWFLTYRATRAHGLASEVLLPALASARSVTISEHVPYEVFDGNLVVGKDVMQELPSTSISLSPGQITELSRAVAGHFDYGRGGVPLCYRPPYHRIEIVSADGAVISFDVSFYCGIFECKDDRHPAEHRHTLPTLLSKRLRECFTRFGLPPRSDAAYEALQRQAAKQ